METARAKLTVLFDPPFWVGVLERERDGGYEACRVVFGAEPRDAEVYAYVLNHYHQLRFSPALPGDMAPERAVSPKRLQRQARDQTRPAGVSTRAQQALALQREQNKLQRRAITREARELERERRSQQRQAKRREKHRGR